MKTTLLFFLLVSFLTIQSSFACGTIKGWAKVASDPSHKMTDQAIYWVQCKPVMKGYKKTRAQQELLASIIKKGLDDSRRCYQSFAIKSFFLFDQLDQLQETLLYEEIQTKIEQFLKKPIAKVHQRTFAYFNFQPFKSYCAIVEREIKSL